MNRLFVMALIGLLFCGSSHANSTPHDLSSGNLTQNWTNTGLITANDDWSGVPSIEGFQGGGLTSSNDVDPQTVLAADDPGTIDVIANQSSGNVSNGGVLEFDGITNPVVGLQGSGSADAPYIRIYLNTTGRQNIQVDYNLRDVDGSADNSTQQVALHYRVGSTGVWTNVAAAYVADASSGPSLATLETPVSVTLPAAADNQALVQLRVLTSNASGADESIGVDDIVVSSTPLASPPTASAVVNNNVSVNGGNDGSATASATGGTLPYTFLWSNGANSATITGLIAGVYTTSVTDALGGFDTASVTITEPTAVVASAVVNNNVSINGGSDGQATASATGGNPGYTYEWSDGSTNATNAAMFAGVYTVTVTDSTGGNDTATVTITQPTPVVASITASSNVTVNGGSDGSATVGASGGNPGPGYTYVWSDAQTTATASGLMAGVYTATVTDSTGGTDTASVTITEPAPSVVASAVVDQNVSINGGSDGQATASATGGTLPYTYLWSTGATTATATALAAGAYTVTVTDANTRRDTAGVTITEPTAVVASAVVNNNVTINGGSDGSATASATGGTMPYTYAWSNGATTAVVSGLAAGVYTVTVTDDNMANDTAGVTITEPSVLVAAATVDNDVSINGGSDGQATASATGGTAPYTYLWSNGAATAVA